MLSCQEKLGNNSLLKENNKIKLVDEPKLIDTLWTNRPSLSKKKIHVLPSNIVSMDSKSKCHKTLSYCNKKGDLSVLVTALDDIAFLCNLRGKDIKYNPVFMSFMFLKKVHGRHEYTLYTSLNKLTDNVKKYLDIILQIQSISSYYILFSDNKKYYYKIRAYKTVDGKKIFGPWSNVKAYTLK